MTSTLAPPRTSNRRPTAARRVGYLVAIIVNVVLVWAVGRLLGWGWPGFLTEDFVQMEGLVTASLVASIAVNASFLVRDRGRFRALADTITNGFGLAVSVRTWNVFPFDFSAYAVDWTWLVRMAVVLGIVGTSIGLIVSLLKLGGIMSDDVP